MGLQKIFRRKKVTSNDISSDERRRMPLSWDEIMKLTLDFSNVIGCGGFSTVYLARINSSMAAVKIYGGGSQRLYQAYKKELDILLRLHHDNIVKILGFCDNRDDHQGALILEYIPNGTLQEKLHKSSNTLLSWKQRVTIAFQLAQAIAYLHENCSPQIIHCDIKSSNILLDENFNCKLCDFGSAKSELDSTSTSILDRNSISCKSNRVAMTMVSSLGYTDPLYLKTGIASKKNDVYGFGVVVLELITGMEAFCVGSGERLTERAEPILREVEKVAEMVDPQLRGGVNLKEARAMAEISAMCLCEFPSKRPTASDILGFMRIRIPSLSFMFERNDSMKPLYVQI